MTERDQQQQTPPSPGGGSDARDVADLLDLHRRGVLTDAQLANLAGGLSPEPAQVPRASRPTSRLLAAVAGAAALVLAGGVAALATTGGDGRPGDGRPSAAACEKARLDAPDLGRQELDAWIEGKGCTWYVRQFEDEIAQDAEDLASSDGADGVDLGGGSGTTAPGFEEYSSEVSAAGEAVLLDESAYSDASSTLCGYEIAEMTAWMRQQIEVGAWPLDALKTSMMNYGSVVRSACPSAVTAYTEAARLTIFAGPSTGTSTDEMPDNLKKKMFDECMVLSETDPAALTVCEQYI